MHTAYKFNQDRVQSTSVPMVPKNSDLAGAYNRASLAAQRFAFENMQKKSISVLKQNGDALRSLVRSHTCQLHTARN